MDVPNFFDVAAAVFHSTPDDVAALRLICDQTDALRNAHGEDDPRVQDGEVRANAIKGMFTRRIAWACFQRDPRFGLRRKTSGQLATRPADGLTHSTDALMLRDTGQIIDAMSDRDVSWGVTPGDTQPLDQWVEPLPELGAVVVPVPAPTPQPTNPNPPADVEVLAQVALLEGRIADLLRTNDDVTRSLKDLSDRVKAIEERPAPAAPPVTLPKLVATGKIRAFGFSYDVKLPVTLA